MEGLPLELGPVETGQGDDVMKAESYHETDAETLQVILHGISSEFDRNKSILTSKWCTLPFSVVCLDTGNSAPVSHRQYRLSQNMMEPIIKKIDKWIANGTICSAIIESPWNSPLLRKFWFRERPEILTKGQKSKRKNIFLKSFLLKRSELLV